MAADIPSRNDTVTTITCPVCGRTFPPSGRRRHCSDACRQAAWRRRRTITTDTPPPPPKNHRRAVTVYQCPNCDARVLGRQRCDDCNTFMRALGTGGQCPCCDEAISIRELTQGGDG